MIDRSSVPQSVSELPDWSAVPSDTEQDRVFLNLRLAYFGGILFVLSGSFYVFNVVVHVAFEREHLHHLVSAGAFAHLAGTAIFGAQWLFCRDARRSAAALNAIDLGGVTLALLAFAIMGVLETHGEENLLVGTLITMGTLITRAVIVPGTSRRTLWITTLASLPNLVGAYIAAGHFMTPLILQQHPWARLTMTLYTAMWTAVIVAMATLASRVIYGLQQRVREATQIGQYVLEEKIGEGGMGAVYRARHALLRRPTAIKLLPARRAGEKNVARFEREVQFTSMLAHPNTIAIYDYGHTPDGVFYYAMEYLEGINLEDLVLYDGPQPPGRVAHILEQVCGALIEAHGAGLIHRDIKPANVMLCVRAKIPDHVKVLDFGLVKEVRPEQAPGVTSAGVLLGTPLYLAPEAIRDAHGVDAKADLYAVGAVAYYLVTGVPVFDERTVVEVCAAHLHKQPVAPSARLHKPIPKALESLILQCLEKDPRARPASAEELMAGLKELADIAPWTARDAQTWWEERGSGVRSAARARRDVPTSTLRTVAVDLAARRRNRTAA